jgi:HSP20 family protein
MALPARVNRNADPFEMAQREFDSALTRMFGRGEMDPGWSVYAVDIREDGDHLYVEAELPGFKKDEVDITLENRVLTISAERKEEHKEGNGKNAGFLLNERRYTRFLRSFTLPTTVDDQGVQAKMDNGILYVTLNKRPETKPRKVTVG